MDRTLARTLLLLLSVSVLSCQVLGQDAADEAVVSETAPAVKPVASVYPQPGGSVPIDSFHKKSQYIIVASKIIRPSTFYQVRAI